MQKLFVIIFFFLIVHFVPAQSNNSGFLGQVITSVLNPDQFKKLYGNKWILMDGRKITGTDLAEITKRSHIPDARGVFIRGMNQGRNDDAGNPDGDTSVGTYQPDTFQGHSFGFVDDWNRNRGLKYTDGYITDRDVNTKSRGLYQLGVGLLDKENDKGLKDKSMQIIPNGNHHEPRISTETRPKNIALYVYIKVEK